MRLCQAIRSIERICVNLAAPKFNANASTRKTKFNATRTKFHLSPTIAINRESKLCYQHCTVKGSTVCLIDYMLEFLLNERFSFLCIDSKNYFMYG